MQFSFVGNNFGIFVLGRDILKQNPKSCVRFFLNPAMPEEKTSIKEQDLWHNAFKSLLKETRFGRIGIFLDRKNFEAADFFQEQINEIKTFEYSPKEKKRALASPQITIFKTQLLREFANEGLADSVEFRRLARKFIRSAKNAGCDLFFFPEAIFGETKTKKILQHLAGSQRQIFTVDEFLSINQDVSDSGVREIKIFQTSESVDFVKKRAQKILETKLPKSVFNEI